MESAPKDPTPQLTAEEEAKKRNTDCVYFLASPLTCIKGADCEYRHSENARLNPRDCYFWLNGSCLNPKCAFRHPPLDSFRGFGGNSTAPSQPSFPPAALNVTAPHVPPHNFSPASSSNKQKTPCYYFQMGACLKGEKCQYMHGPQQTPQTAVGDGVPSQPAKVAAVLETSSMKKTLTNGSASEVPTMQLKRPQPAAALPVQASHSIRPTPSLSPFPTAVDKTQKGKVAGEIPVVAKAIHATEQAPSTNAISRITASQPLAADDRYQNGKDVDEFHGESSPGFDVLVDNEEEDDEYFPSHENDIERSLGHNGRHLPLTDFDYGRPSGLNSLDNYEGEYPDDIGASYDMYGRRQDQYGWEDSRASVERISGRSSIIGERRQLSRGNTPDQIDDCDLRYRLSKRRRANGSGATVSPPNHQVAHHRRDDPFVNDPYRRRSRDDHLRTSGTDSLVSKRLQGRVRFPGRSSTAVPSEPYSNVETDRERRHRSPPGRHALYLAIQDRLKGRISKETEVRSIADHHVPVGDRKVDRINFAGPKSLAEIKNRKVNNGNEEERPVMQQQVLRSKISHVEESVKTRKSVSQEPVAPVAFEGPKPLSAILKRKRETGSGAPTEPTSSHNAAKMRKEGYSNKLYSHNISAKVEGHEKDGDVRKEHGVESGEVSRERDDVVEEEDDDVMADADYQNVGNDDREEGAWVDEAEGENPEADAEQDDEYLDDDDGDDFARKLGVMFS